MNLTEKEREKMEAWLAGFIAEQRKEAGLKLNHPEAVAYITKDIMEGVPEMIPMIQVECTFPDGTKLVTVHDPIK